MPEFGKAQEMGPLVSTQWLLAHLDDPDLRILDGSWYLPEQNRDADEEYAHAHIPGAGRFDLDSIADLGSALPHMLPSAADFAYSVGQMGIGPRTRVVVYDGAGLFSAARVWWMFRVFGHAAVAVLDGGFKKWQSEGRPSTARRPKFAVQEFDAVPDRGAVCTLEQMVANLRSQQEQVLDARPRSRFLGQTPEPRPGLRSGHIPPMQLRIIIQ